MLWYKNYVKNPLKYSKLKYGTTPVSTFVTQEIVGVIVMYANPVIRVFQYWNKVYKYCCIAFNDSTCQFYYMERIRKVAGW